MEAVLVGVATGVMKPLLSKLSTLLEEEYAKLKGVRRNTRFIREEMTTMSATLQMLADEPELNPQMKEWRDNVRELSYDMEDCVDDFMARVDRKPDGSSGLRTVFDWVKNLKPRHEIAGEIEQLKIRAIEASKRRKRYEFKQLPTTHSSSSAIDPRLEALYVETDKLVGIEGPKKDIVEWLKKKSSSTEVQVVSIVGPGGLGKTTLANQIFATMKDRRKQHFSCAAFISVSQKRDMKDVLREIADRVGITHNTSNDTAKTLTDRLQEHLQYHRYFIVIDDIWDTKDWNTIWSALKNNNYGSRIITTTRKKEVASHSSSRGGYFYEMGYLGIADSKRLFFERAFGSQDLCNPGYPHLEEISNDILEKCAGLPLAIITMSSLLANQNAEKEWNRVLAAIGTALANHPKAGDMKLILDLSYFDLPHYLRTCLLYLSLFPEDHIIDTKCLISRWIAEGFIPKEQGQSLYEVGEGYFNELVNRSLIQPVDVKYGQVMACRVHDIVLDFITCKAIEENFATPSYDVGASIVSVRRLCVRNRRSEKCTIPTTHQFSHVRSLSVFGSFVENSLSDFPALRVLDLGACPDLENYHLANIEKLFLLKYLRLSSSRITELPREIGELQYLETLDIQGTRIMLLPSTIARLQQLARLYIPQDAIFPVEIVGQLLSLEDLYYLKVNSSEEWKYLQEIVQLTKLRTLLVTFDGLAWMHSGGDMDLQSYVTTLIASCNLENLYISYSLDNCIPYRLPLSLETRCPTTVCSFKKLRFSYCYISKIPGWMSSFGNLWELEFSIYRLSSEDVAILGAIPTLVFLKVNTFYGRYGTIFIRRGFTSLKSFNLEINCCGTALEFEAGSMPKLEHLELQLKPHKAECLNGAVSDFGIQYLSALTNVKVIILVRSETAEEVVSLVEKAVGTLPNYPALSFFSRRYDGMNQISNNRQTGAEDKEQAIAGDTFSSFMGRMVQEINQDAYDMSRLRMQ
ncbi:disease resistance protein RGA5-like [Lolium rigidum]|uniref:disease resistance protein RGA5-like n=1 Tax=Lolium rigidum TaxID=89674 RepID=UPI001F5DA10B|nr:disease resistance protein RGA5-like [Lolium rigidum]